MDDLTRAAVRARDGDRDALGDLVRRSQADVWRLCVHLVGRAGADDVVQEAYERAIRSLPRFRAEASARTWLLVIARRTCADEIRRLQRRRRLDGRLRQGRPDEAVPDAGTAVELDEGMAALAWERREAFVLTQVLGLSYAEAAEVADVPVGTIRSRVSRARSDLLDHLGEPRGRTGTEP
ncbi:MAG: sigma-70 family RNA polymerase sigma factor [Acidimicrobiales bacterium]|nr:sigma-70 family RNA polymerase sigma factor [Acidimicrobiales bacterium]